MSLITKNNYEAFLLDYVEENLSPEHTAELMLFFENNPELKEDLDGFEMLSLNPSNESLADKKALKIDEDKVTALTFDDFAIAEIEGLNSDKQSEELAVFLKQNPSKQKDFETYQQTKLAAPVVVFEDKPALKREQKVIPLYWWYTSAAAVILALFLLKGINWSDEKVTPVIANEIENLETNKTPINNVEAVVEEHLVAEELEVNEKLEQKDEIIVQPKKQEPILVQEKEPEVILANETTPVLDKDSVVDVVKNPKEELIEDEELLLASTDDVVIVYKDEVIEDNPSQNTTQKKPSKFNAVRAAIKQQVRDKFLDKVKDESTLAINDGPLRFFRRKK